MSSVFPGAAATAGCAVSSRTAAAEAAVVRIMAVSPMTRAGAHPVYAPEGARRAERKYSVRSAEVAGCRADRRGDRLQPVRHQVEHPPGLLHAPPHDQR